MTVFEDKGCVLLLVLVVLDQLTNVVSRLLYLRT